MLVGAEGKVYESTFLTKPSIVKQRLTKRYRVTELDQKINKQRLLQEARCMVRCRKAGIQAPRSDQTVLLNDINHILISTHNMYETSMCSIFFVDIINCQLHMEKIAGTTVKDMLSVAYSTG